MLNIKAKDATVKRVNAKKSIVNVSMLEFHVDRHVDARNVPMVLAKIIELQVPKLAYLN